MTYVVAEISGNHGGILDNALLLIRKAKEAGADAVKFQCFEAEKLAARRANNPEVLLLADGVPLIDLYRKTETPKEWFRTMVALAEMLGIDWFSSVFDPDDVSFLELYDCPKYKISAFEMLDWDIIKAVRETGKPIVMSVRPMHGVTLLQASDYVGNVPMLGLSAHGDIKPAPRAPMVEYHLKLDDVATPDSAFSLTPDQLKAMVTAIRDRRSMAPPQVSTVRKKQVGDGIALKSMTDPNFDAAGNCINPMMAKFIEARVKKGLKIKRP